MRIGDDSGQSQHRMTAFALLSQLHFAEHAPVNWLPRDPNGRMTLYFLLFVGALLVVMKLAAWWIRGRRTPAPRRFWLSPLPAPNSLARTAPRSELNPRLVRAALSAGALALGYSIFWNFILPLELPPWILGYLGVPFLLLFSSVLVAVITLLWLPMGGLFPALHQNPLLARSIADFWGRRWNLWFSDWFRFTILGPLRRRPTLAVVLVFLVSGLVHEWVVNGALYLAADRNRFGTMMLYFLLQAAGLLFERRCLSGKPATKRILAWLVVGFPAPLVVNEGLLRALHLWPY